MAPRSLLLAILGALSARRLAVGAVAGALLIIAGVSLVRMPLQLLPEIRYPQVRVIGDLPGQTSSVIEEGINEPMEAALEGVPGVVQMESRSGDGRAYIDLFFEPDYDLDRALQDVMQAGQRAQDQIPPEFPEPRIFAVSTMEDPVFQVAFGSDVHAAPEIRQRLRANLLPRLRAIEGVDQVFMGREEDPELVVEVDPERQASLGVGLDAVEDFLVEATDAPPSSPLRTPYFEGIGVLGTNGWDAGWLHQSPLPVDGGEQSVPLHTLAHVHRAPSEESLRTRLDGRSAVLVAVHRSPQAHALRTAEEIQATVEDVADDSALEGIEANVLYDDSVVTGGAVRSVVVAASGGAFLAMLLLALTLRHRRYVPLVAVLVGVSLASAVVALHALGLTLNLLTLAGLLLSVGLGLDYAIIYFDRLDRLRRLPPEARDGEAPVHLRAMADVFAPLLGALLTTLAAILPFLFVEGLIALLFRPLIVTVTVTAVLSFLSAVVLLSTFSRADPSDGDDPATDGPTGFWDWRVWGWGRTPVAAWGMAAVLGAILVMGGRALPFEVLPVVDDGFVEVRITHPVGIPIDHMDRLTRQVESRLMGVEGTQALFTTVGGYFREGLPSYRPGTANFMLEVDTDGGARPSSEWADDAREAIEGMGLPELGMSVTLPEIRGVETRLSEEDVLVVLTRDDDDILALAEVESQVEGILQNVEGLQDVERVRGGVSPRWEADPRNEALQAQGVSAIDVGRVLEYALDGRILRQRMDRGEPLGLRVRYDRRNAGGVQDLEQLRVPSLADGDVPLGALVDFQLIEEPTHIERREGQRVVRVGAQLDPDGPGAAAVGENVEEALAGADLPEGVSWWLEGELEALEETQQTFGLALTLALFMVLALLTVQYGSIPFALAGLISIPLSAAGTMILLRILGQPLDAMVLAGLLIAVGVVANNVILVLSQARMRSTGPDAVGLSEALEWAARERLRPITLTVFSTVLGMSPLLWGGAEVFGLLQPLAIALTGALLVSIPLAFLVLPGLASSLANVDAWLRRTAPAEGEAGASDP